MSKIIKQFIITPNSNFDINLIAGHSLLTLGVYSIPGGKIKIDDLEIIINQTGLFNIDLSIDKAIKSLIIPREPNQSLLNNSQSQMIIDCIYI